MIPFRDKINQIGLQAREASKILAKISYKQKNEALLAMAAHILNDKESIIEANKKDIEQAETKELSESFIDRLKLNENRVQSIARTLREIASFEDPVGKVLDSWTRPNGLNISRISTPLGTIGIIYESRPNVTADAGGLCLKSGNAAILRGGSDSIHSCVAIHKSMTKGLNDVGITEHAIQIIEDKNREAVNMMLQGINKCIDIIVPRGGRGLVTQVEKEARVPIFAHLEGICHIYIDKDADLNKAINVCVNAKMRRPGICGAVETILVHSEIAKICLPDLVNAFSAKDCEIRGCKETQKFSENIIAASDKDWRTEYLLPIVSIKVIKNLNEALMHISTYSSGHTESIMTENLETAAKFQNEIDSAIVMHNTSTQFADGGEFGLGGEIGIATGKFHARGPIGANQLTSFKYLVNGDGHIRR
jgi:glutamate-5-semialdehyde dehydrogenase